MQTLIAKTRKNKENLHILKKDGYIPAVLYGKKQETISISLKQSDFVKIWKEAGESTVLGLKLPEEELEALIHDVDVDPITSEPRHVDFYVFEKGHKIEVDVPIEFVGVSSAVKDKGGILVKVKYEVSIEAMPKDLPHNIEVDISVLKEIGDQITSADIKLPSGVTLNENEEDVIVSISEPKEEEPEEVVEIDMSAIEVEKKGKADEEEGGEGEGGKKEEPEE